MFAGIYNRQINSTRPGCFSDKLFSALDPFKTADKKGTWSDNTMTLSQTLLFNNAGSCQESVPYTDETGRFHVLFWGRLTNRDDLFQDLGFNISGLNTISDAALVSQSYQTWGAQCIDRFYGDYALAVYDSVTRDLTCCTDHMGSKPFYYFLDDHWFIFSSTLSLFHYLEMVPVRPDMMWATRYLCRLSTDYKATAYDGIVKLPPGHCLKVSKESHHLFRYFSFQADETVSQTSLASCLETYRSLLEAAVSSRTDTRYPLGSELSGGLDSSTVTAIAARHFKGDVDDFHTFGLALHKSEPEYIRSVCRKYGIRNNHIYYKAGALTSDILDRSLDVLGAPYDMSISILHHPFYALGRMHNVRTLLSGFGGDECVTSIHGNIALKELLSSKKYAAYYTRLPGNSFVAPLRFLKQFATYRFSSFTDVNPNMLRTRELKWAFFFPKPELAAAYDLEQTWFKKPRFNASYDNLNRFTLEKRLTPHIPTRMHDCTLMARSFGIDYAWPLLDVRLICFFLSLPVEYKFKKINRYFHRKAVACFLPEKNCWKKSKYMGERIHPPDQQNSLKLNKDLHPDIFAVADIEALTKHLKTTPPLVPEYRFALKHSAQAVNILDLWMKKFFPNGCQWANAP